MFRWSDLRIYVAETRKEIDRIWLNVTQVGLKGNIVNHEPQRGSFWITSTVPLTKLLLIHLAPLVPDVYVHVLVN